MVCVISFCFGWYGGMRRQRAILSASSQALTMEVDELHAAVAASTNRANGLSIVLQATGMQLERVSAELRQATQAYQSAMNAAREHRRALQIAVGDLNDGYTRLEWILMTIAWFVRWATRFPSRMAPTFGMQTSIATSSMTVAEKFAK